MEEYLPFVSLDTWTMIFTWANLVILFLLLKKFLFKPVNKVLEERAAEIAGEYKSAEDAKYAASSMKTEYEQKLRSANAEAESIIKSAVNTANERSNSIVDEANDEAKRIIEKSQKQIETDKRNAMDAMKKDIASVAVDAAEKILKREIDASADDDLLSDIIDRM